MTRSLFFLFLFFSAVDPFAPPLHAQTPAVQRSDALPKSTLYVGDLRHNDGGHSLTRVRAITGGDGYHNQPSFAPDGSLYYTKESEPGRTDVWRYRLDAGRHEAVLTTLGRSEYSPRVTRDGKHLMFIAENRTGDRTSLWEMSLTIGPDSARERNSLAPVGYYAVLSDATAFFYRSDPPTLLIEDASGVQEQNRGIGRTLQASPDGTKLYFLQTAQSGPGALSVYDMMTGLSAPLFQLPPDATGFFYVQSEQSGETTAFMTTASAIVERPLSASGVLRPLAKLADLGLATATRLAISPDGDHIAVVGEAAAP